MNSIKIFVVGKNRAELFEWREIVESAQNAEVCGFSLDGKTAAEKMREIKPDMLIVDYLIPGYDGLGIIEDVRSDPALEGIYIILVVPHNTDSLVSQALKAGADHIIVKPVHGELLRTRIDEAAKKLQNPTPFLQDDVTYQITKMMGEIGVPPQLKGFQYIRAGILIALHNPEALSEVTKTLYVQIAEKCFSSPTKVERDIRHAIEVTWNRGNMDAIDRAFGYSVDASKGKPTNAAFIATLYDKIRIMNYKIN